MNINPVLAILVLKKIITNEEAERVAEFVHDKPQSTILREVINQVKDLLDMSQEPLTGGPTQQQEELAARERAAAEGTANIEGTITDENGHHHPVAAEPVETEQAEDKDAEKEDEEKAEPTNTTSDKKAEDKDAKK